MKPDHNGTTFFEDFKDHLTTLDNAIQYCKIRRLKERNSEVRILACFVLSILYEVSDYLTLFADDIEKKFGFSTDHEWELVRDQVFSPIHAASKGTTNHEAVITMLDNWLHYDIKTERELIRAFASNDK